MQDRTLGHGLQSKKHTLGNFLITVLVKRCLKYAADAGYGH